MKFFRFKIINFSIFLALILISGQTVSSQETPCDYGLQFEEILSKFTTRRTISPEPVNKELIGEIPKRKTGFELNEANEKTLRNAGANDLLIKLIRENVLPEAVEAHYLQSVYLSIYHTDNFDELGIAIYVAREFVRKFEANKCYTEHVKYYKDAIVILDNNYSKNPDSKAYFKCKLLQQFDTQYKAKNWRELLTLGVKVLEIDPDFLPMAIFLASFNYDLVKNYGYANVYNKETIRYATHAIELMESDRNSYKNIYGGYEYNFKTKAEALSRMREILEEMNKQIN